MLRVAIFIAGLAASLPTVAQARERVLAPTDDWQLARSAESCVLQRNFRDTFGAPLRFTIEAFRPGQTYKFTMVGDALPLRDGLRRGVGVLKYRFKPDPDWRETGMVTGYSGGEDAVWFESDLSTKAESVRRANLVRDGEPLGLGRYQPDSVRAAHVVQFALRYPSRDDTVLQLGSLSEPIMQLQTCARQLIVDWGYDPDALDGQSSPPVITNAEEIGSQIIREMQAASMGHTQAINLRMDVDLTGRVSGCAIQAPRRDNAVEALICRVMSEKSAVIPARDAAGAPMASPYFSRINFGVR